LKEQNSEIAIELACQSNPESEKCNALCGRGATSCGTEWIAWPAGQRQRDFEIDRRVRDFKIEGLNNKVEVVEKVAQ
jgi:hypothetical protein